MDQRLQTIVENFDKMKLDLDEPFQFRCKQCGKCCVNREDILLSPSDLFRISKKLGLPVEETFKQYCETYIGQDSKLPVVRLKPRGSIKRCPLLQDRKCVVHDAKPAVCALFPLGRAVMLDAKEYATQGMAGQKTQYILQPVDCGAKDETHTVREWLGKFGLPAEDATFHKWQETIMDFSTMFRAAQKKVPESVLHPAWTLTLVALYLSYDIKKEFLPQLEENVQKLKEALTEVFMPEEGAE